MQPAGSTAAVLTIDLDAIVANWRLLAGRVKPAEAAAVVKADAYGLGLDAVASALHGGGCNRFFVATLDEGLALRRLLAEAEIAVLFGPDCSDAEQFRTNRLTPVLNHLGQVEVWSALSRAGSDSSEPLAAIIQVDTGMSRLGFPPEEVARLSAEPERLAGIAPCLLMSHLARAEEPGAAMNREQLARFQALRTKLAAVLGACPASFANSSGIFLGADYHFDLARPGVALYGVNPTPEKSNPMAEVVRLQGKILQVRCVDSPQTVGYGATHAVMRPSRIATVPVGYADGYLRSASNQASGHIEGVRVAIVGRVSMDMITIDVSDVPPEAARPGATVDLIGGPYPVDALAADANTIGYEVLTSLGRRYRRRYLVGGSATNLLAVIGRAFFALFEIVGRVLLFTLDAVSHCIRPPIYARLIVKQMIEIGYYSLPVVGLTGIFAGMVLALQSYTGFSRFAAESTIPTVVVLSITRELGPVLAGLMVAGRVGAAMAAEIGTMRVTEQIDALTTLSTNPYKYLIVPRLIAGLLMLPCLVLVADIIGVLGGYLVSVYQLDFNSEAYISNTFEYLEVMDVVSGRGGAQGVGSATTNAVVWGAILVLVFNYVITAAFFSQ
jgi:alanine racemase